MPKYIITNGIKCLRMNQRGDYYLVGERDATEWATYKQALNALNNGLAKGTRDSFYVEKAGKINSSPSDIHKIIEADTGDFNRWLSDIGNFKKFVNTIGTIKSELFLELSEIDKEICDIRHYMEFGRLNACQGWAAYEMMKTSLQQRRKIKDVLYIISEIQGRRDGVSACNSARIAIHNLNNRIYTPRKLNFLFEGNLIFAT